MLLSVFTRHSTGCKFSEDRACRRCNCPKWVGGQINGYYFRQSAKTRQFAEAETVRLQRRRKLRPRLRHWGPPARRKNQRYPRPHRHLSRVRPLRRRRPFLLMISGPTRPRVTIAQAVEAYLADAVSRSVEASTLKKLETIFRKQFLAWTRVHGFEFLDELDLDALLNFRTHGKTARSPSKRNRAV